MRVKVCGIRTDDDLDAAVKAGADAVGLLVGQLHASADFILPGTACRLARILPPFISPIIVTHLIEAGPILDILNKAQIFNVQLHGGSPLKDVAEIRDKIPSSGKIILAVHMINGQAVPDFEPFIPHIDALVMDSYNKNTDQVGGTGKVHDWVKSSELAASSRVPIILAGGLNPSNVAEAVRIVHPYGVDANSGLKDENRNCSAKLCRDFVRNAKSEFLGK
ncbi:MAG TPA: phosphoribosylanthranilate isomerase [Victivallales bacterium]|nr:phosphoribosylanthranilate isomerase [Victivallales bacterium]